MTGCYLLNANAYTLEVRSNAGRVSAMSGAEQIYSSKQVARVMDISGGMLRRYALALEQMTGEPIPQDPRDGRRFSQHHIELLTSARRFVIAHRGMSVEDGLRRAIGLAEEVPAAPLLRSLPGDSPDLVAAFTEVVGPLVDELRALRSSNTRLADEVEGLRHEVREQRALPLAEGKAMSERTDERTADGMLVKVARQLERLLGRGRSR